MLAIVVHAAKRKRTEKNDQLPCNPKSHDNLSDKQEAAMARYSLGLPPRFAAAPNIPGNFEDTAATAPCLEGLTAAQRLKLILRPAPSRGSGLDKWT